MDRLPQPAASFSPSPEDCNHALWIRCPPIVIYMGSMDASDAYPVPKGLRMPWELELGPGDAFCVDCHNYKRGHVAS